MGAESAAGGGVSTAALDRRRFAVAGEHAPSAARDRDQMPGERPAAGVHLQHDAGVTVARATETITAVALGTADARALGRKARAHPDS